MGGEGKGRRGGRERRGKGRGDGKKRGELAPRCYGRIDAPEGRQLVNVLHSIIVPFISFFNSTRVLINSRIVKINHGISAVLCNMAGFHLH